MMIVITNDGFSVSLMQIICFFLLLLTVLLTIKGSVIKFIRDGFDSVSPMIASLFITSFFGLLMSILWAYGSYGTYLKGIAMNDGKYAFWCRDTNDKWWSDNKVGWVQISKDKGFRYEPEKNILANDKTNVVFDLDIASCK